MIFFQNMQFVLAIYLYRVCAIKDKLVFPKIKIKVKIEIKNLKHKIY